MEELNFDFIVFLDARVLNLLPLSVNKDCRWVSTQKRHL